MPKFSNQLIQGLTNPTYSDNLAQAGMLMGSAPRRAREEEDRKKRQGAAQAITTQGMQGAQAGEVPRLDVQIAKMQELAAASPSAKERAVLEGKVNTLQGMRQMALNKQSNNHVSAVLKINKMLDKPESLDPRAKTAFEDRREQLLGDVDVERKVMQVQSEQNKAQTEQEARDSKAWVEKNLGALSAAAQDLENPNRIAAVLKSAPEGSRLASQKLANDFTNAARSDWEFKQKQKGARVVTNVEGAKALLEGLPQEYLDSAQPLLTNLEKIAKEGKNSDGTWKTGEDTKYKRAEQMFSDQVRSFRNSAATTAFAQSTADDKDYKDDMFVAELRVNQMPDQVKVNRMAAVYADQNKRPGKPTKADYSQAHKDVLDEMNYNYTQEVKAINARYGRTEAEEAPTENKAGSRADRISAYVTASYSDGNSYAHTKAKLKEMGIEGAEAEEFLEPSATDGAFGGSYMSSKRLAPEAAYVKKLRGGS